MILANSGLGIGGYMVQRHSIILWKKAEKEDKKFEEIAKETYEVLKLFQEYPQELRPNYLTARAKKDIKEFDWNYENFRSTLKKGINKECENIFEDLGYSISFFSSLNGQNSCGFEIIAGNKNEKFYNVLIVNLPLSLNLYDEKIADMVKRLFEKLTQSYKPYWGCVSNKALSRKYGKYLEGSLPTTVHWINYWSEDILETIGMEKIQNVITKNAMSTFKTGILSIKETALDVEKEDDIRFHTEMHNQLLV